MLIFLMYRIMTWSDALIRLHRSSIGKNEFVPSIETKMFVGQIMRLFSKSILFGLEEF